MIWGNPDESILQIQLENVVDYISRDKSSYTGEMQSQEIKGK